jgi:hypothetical protein
MDSVFDIPHILSRCFDFIPIEHGILLYFLLKFSINQRSTNLRNDIQIPIVV